MENSKPKEIFKLKNICELIPGDILLHPLFRDDGLMLINKYTKLTPFYTKKINLYYTKDCLAIVVENLEDFKKFLIQKLFESNEYIEALKKVVEANKGFSNESMSIELYLGTKFENNPVVKAAEADEEPVIEKQTEIGEDYSLILNTLTSTPFWNSIENFLEAPAAQARVNNVKTNLISRLSTDNQLLELLKKMKEYDELLILHQINKLCVSLSIGACLEMKEEELTQLSFCVLFSCIGFVNLHQAEYYSYLRKKVHNELADKIISNSINILSKTEFCRSKNIIYGVLDQYEMFNGGGAPLKKKGKDISLFGRILFIASIYERLVNGYFNESAFSHNEAIDIIWNDENQKMDMDIIKIYIYRTNIYKIGQSTLLYFGKSGEIIGFTNYLDAPIYPVIKYSDGTIIDYYGKI